MVTREDVLKWSSAAWDLISRRKRAYAGIPEAVIEDLAKFCRATETCFHADPRLHAVAEGRREVFLRIMHYRNLTNDELFARYGGTLKQTSE